MNDFVKQRENCILLSYELLEDSPSPAGIPGVVTEAVYTLENDESNVFKSIIYSHSGTHVDAPAHMIGSGRRINEIDVCEFIYENTFVIDIDLRDSELIKKRHLESYENGIALCDLLIIRTGWWKYRVIDKKRYINKNPGFSIEAAMYLSERFPLLRAIGFDFISLAAAENVQEGIEAHKILLKKRNMTFLIYEDMDLSGDLNGLRRVIALPWLIGGFDSSPCTIVGLIQAGAAIC